MDQQLAVDTLVALPSETPYPFTALATVCSLERGKEYISAQTFLTDNRKVEEEWKHILQKETC